VWELIRYLYGGGVNSEMSYESAFIADLRALSRLSKKSRFIASLAAACPPSEPITCEAASTESIADTGEDPNTRLAEKIPILTRPTYFKIFFVREVAIFIDSFNNIIIFRV
jgi:hypothetical protein